jgi:opacity protein-like surface antigen
MARRGQQRVRGAKRSWRVPFPWAALLLLLLTARVSVAQWDFTHAGDPNRNWGVTASESVGYDDNFNATEKNPQAGVRDTADVKFRASVPLERFFAGMQYDYSVTYPQDVKLGGVNETHNLNLSANYTVNPRLALTFSENFVNSLQPGLVQNIAGAPVTVTQAGTYIYDNVGGGLIYSLSPRWSVSVSGSWDIWEYQTSSLASNDNHQDYSATLSALYLLDTRTTVGVNYQYGQDVFVNAGTNNGLDAISHTLYLSVVRRFNPRLSMSLNGGYTIRESQDGTQSTSPSVYGSLVYNYGPLSTITLTVAQALSEATVGVSRQFSAQQNTSLVLQISHRVSARLRAIGDITYVYSSFTQQLGAGGTTGPIPIGGFPNPTFIPPPGGGTISPNEQALTCHLGLNYAFRDWLSATLNYDYTQLSSSDSALIQPYTRNEISTGISLIY